MLVLDVLLQLHGQAANEGAFITGIQTVLRLVLFEFVFPGRHKITFIAFEAAESVLGG